MNHLFISSSSNQADACDLAIIFSQNGKEKILNFEYYFFKGHRIMSNTFKKGIPSFQCFWRIVESLRKCFWNFPNNSFPIFKDFPNNRSYLLWFDLKLIDYRPNVIKIL